ncbi:MAG: PDZ domain-containing protein, partial [Oxalobacter sp.]|nr:PDZ domain-containing protein [Oxalobacter sp.]
ERVTYSTALDRYNYFAIFYVKNLIRNPIGFVTHVKMTNEDRIRLKRNTGALLYLVIEDSAAYDANMLPGDLIIEFNDKTVKDGEHLLSLMDEVYPLYATKPLVRKTRVKVLRDGEILNFVLDLKDL